MFKIFPRRTNEIKISKGKTVIPKGMEARTKRQNAEHTLSSQIDFPRMFLRIEPVDSSLPVGKTNLFKQISNKFFRRSA